MLGAIICGGKSTRMGVDKGTIYRHEKTWAEISANHFIDLGIPFVLSVNQGQKDVYGKTFSHTKIIVDDDAMNVKGPLLALMSIHQAFPSEDVLVLACDMIDMQPEPLQYLIDAHFNNNNNNYGAFLFKANTDLQPLCCIYTAGLLAEILNKAHQGELKKFSLKSLLESSNCFIEDLPGKWLNCFNNYNSPEDLINFQEKL